MKDSFRAGIVRQSPVQAAPLLCGPASRMVAIPARRTTFQGATTMKNTEQLVQELLDREAIRDLPKRYCHCVWTGDLDGIVNLFSEDGCMIMQSSKGPQTTAGRDKLRKTFARVVDELGPRPYIHNHVLQLKDANHASGTCYVELRDSKNDMR